MSGHVAAMTPLAFAPASTVDTATQARPAASPTSVARFEQLLYARPTSVGAATGTAAPVLLHKVDGAGLRQYVEQVSQRWDAGQMTLQRMAGRGQFTAQDLVFAQMQLVNCALDMEVSSRCAGMFENGVQTLIQRSG